MKIKFSAYRHISYSQAQTELKKSQENHFLELYLSILLMVITDVCMQYNFYLITVKLIYLVPLRIRTVLKFIFFRIGQSAQGHRCELGLMVF